MCMYDVFFVIVDVLVHDDVDDVGCSHGMHCLNG
jgi:hypothetical protein